MTETQKPATELFTPQKVRLAWYRRYINFVGPLVMIVALTITMAIAEPRFFEVSNLMIILQDAAIYMVLGMAMTIVITAKGIDLSVGAVAALSAVIMAMLIKDQGWGPFPAIIAALLVGLCCGLANGLVITKLKVPDLLATLAMDQVYRGIALVLAAGTVLARFPEPIPFLGRGKIMEILPTASIIGLVALLLGYVIYHYTWLGRYAVAIGANREAAIQTGINIDRQKLFQYALMGTCAAIAGILLAGRLNAIQATAAHGTGHAALSVFLAAYCGRCDYYCLDRFLLLSAGRQWFWQPDVRINIRIEEDTVTTSS